MHIPLQVRKDFYSACTFLAMILYWALLMDLAIFSMRISAYVLVCGRVTGEVALFLSALLLLLLACLGCIAFQPEKKLEFDNSWKLIKLMSYILYIYMS